MNQVKNGTITRDEAQRLSRIAQRIAPQEKQNMAANGGYLTKQEQQQLNRI